MSYLIPYGAICIFALIGGLIAILNARKPKRDTLTSERFGADGLPK